MSANIIIYNASAGSGKTYQLSVNYLKLLNRIQQNSAFGLKNILAITFTNKAAFEMKERVIQFLKEIIKNTPKGESLKKELNIDSKRAEEILNEIFLNYDAFQIKTIDSFLLNLYRALAYELNLISDFQIKKYVDESLIEKALDKLFEEAYQNKYLMEFLEKFIDFLLETEDKLKIDIKNKLINSLEKVLQNLTYKREFIQAINFYQQKDLKKVLEEINSNSFSKEKEKLSTDFYLTLYALLKFKLEEIFFREKTLFIGLWKEKLSSFLNSQEDFIPWIYVKLGNLEGIIIDEFQDTDRVQWEAIYPIVEDLISRRGVLICAGDPKQSIFQWRGGDPYLLEEICTNFSHYPLKIEVLNKNYRSSPEIVEFNNQFFSLLKENEEIKKEVLNELIFGKNNKFEKKEEILKEVLKELEQNFKNVKQESVKREKGKVLFRFVKISEILGSRSYKKYIKKELDELIKGEILNILKELKEKEDFEDIAILVRRNEEITELSSFLLSEGFKVIGTSFLKLKESSVVNTLISLLKFLNYPEDQIALAGFLSGGFSPQGTQIFIKYYEARASGRNISLIDFVKTEYQSFWESCINHLLKKSRTFSFYELCQYIVQFFNIKNVKQEEQAYLYEFLSIVLDFSYKGGTLEEFLEYWEKYSEDELELPKDKEAIKILTIHLAKGLEFKHVILPLTWEERNYTTDLGLIFYNGNIYKGKKKDLSEEAQIGWYLEKARNKLELFNLLYVAFTRAIKNLYLIIPDTQEIKSYKFEGLKIFSKIYSFLEK